MSTVAYTLVSVSPAEDTASLNRCLRIDGLSLLTGGQMMITYRSKMFAHMSEAESYLSTYQMLIEEVGGKVSIETWERKETDQSTRITETTTQEETTIEVRREVETLQKRGPVLYVTLPEEIALLTLLTGSEALAFTRIG